MFMSKIMLRALTVGALLLAVRASGSSRSDGLPVNHWDYESDTPTGSGVSHSPERGAEVKQVLEIADDPAETDATEEDPKHPKTSTMWTVSNVCRFCCCGLLFGGLVSALVYLISLPQEDESSDAVPVSSAPTPAPTFGSTYDEYFYPKQYPDKFTLEGDRLLCNGEESVYKTNPKVLTQVERDLCSLLDKTQPVLPFGYAGYFDNRSDEHIEKIRATNENAEASEWLQTVKEIPVCEATGLFDKSITTKSPRDITEDFITEANKVAEVVGKQFVYYDPSKSYDTIPGKRDENCIPLEFGHLKDEDGDFCGSYHTDIYGAPSRFGLDIDNLRPEGDRYKCNDHKAACKHEAGHFLKLTHTPNDPPDNDFMHRNKPGDITNHIRNVLYAGYARSGKHDGWLAWLHHVFGI